jgi:hypothetical protein
MKKIFALAGGLVALSTALVLAQASPVPSPYQAWGQMVTLRQQERTDMLAALTPAHRTLVSNLIGGLATAANPNPDGVAAKIDAALSQSEKASILRIHNDTDTKIVSLMQSMHQQMGGYGPGPQAMWGYGYGPGMMYGRGYGPGMMGGYGPGYGPGARYGARSWSDPGYLLLFVASSSTLSSRNGWGWGKP